jgi:hypothetical protein
MSMARIQSMARIESMARIQSSYEMTVDIHLKDTPSAFALVWASISVFL